MKHETFYEIRQFGMAGWETWHQETTNSKAWAVSRAKRVRKMVGAKEAKNIRLVEVYEKTIPIR
jgi:hypothetical protein